MANGIERLLIVGTFSAFFDVVKAYYCDNDKCLEDQFCCGENICCVSYKVWELWYFWCGILFCLFLLSVCGCFWRERQRAYWVFHTPSPPYRPLNPEEDAKYNPSHKERSLSPQFFSQTTSWYSPHLTGSLPAKAYTDNEQMYDTSSGRKPDY